MDLELYRSFVFAIAYAITHSLEDAEDLTQETFLRAFRTIDSGTIIRNPKGYLRRITNNLAFNFLEHRNLRQTVPLESWIDEVKCVQTSERSDHAELVAIEVDKLSYRQRTILRLRYWEGSTLETIARELNETRESVATQLEIAHRQLRRAIEELEV